MIWQSVLVLITNVVKNQFMLKSDQSTNCKERIGTYTTIQIQKDGELVAKTAWLLVKMLETITMPVRLETVKLLTYMYFFSADATMCRNSNFEFFFSIKI